MDRFASNTVNNVDRKGRVSIPAAFRAALGGQSSLRGLLSVEHPVVEAGGQAMMDAYERRLEKLDPFSQAYEDWSHYILGDALELKLDGEGRIQINDRLREHTGITDQVLFEGRGISFWLWEPGKYDAYRTAARARVRDMRRALGSGGSDSGAGARTDGGAGA
jgi:MraZ protein